MAASFANLVLYFLLVFVFLGIARIGALIHSGTNAWYRIKLLRRCWCATLCGWLGSICRCSRPSQYFAYRSGYSNYPYFDLALAHHSLPCLKLCSALVGRRSLAVQVKLECYEFYLAVTIISPAEFVIVKLPINYPTKTFQARPCLIGTRSWNGWLPGGDRFIRWITMTNPEWH